MLYFLEFIDKSLCQVDANFCLWMLDVLRTNRAWALSMAKEWLLKTKDRFWYVDRLNRAQIQFPEDGFMAFTCKS